MAVVEVLAVAPGAETKAHLWIDCSEIDCTCYKEENKQRMSPFFPHASTLQSVAPRAWRNPKIALCPDALASASEVWRKLVL